MELAIYEKKILVSDNIREHMSEAKNGPDRRLALNSTVDKGKVSVTSLERPIRPALISGFHSMK